MNSGSYVNRMKTGILSFDDGRKYPYRIVQSDRRTMALQVTKTGEVIVRMPWSLPLQAGHELAQKNRSWIYPHLEKIREASNKHELFHWSEGALVLLFGKERILRVVPDFGNRGFWVKDTQEELILTGPIEDHDGFKGESAVKDILKDWYRKEAKRYLVKKAAWWAVKMKVSYGRIAVRDQKTRWGSCSTRGNLNFNWRLVLVPEELADYVVVHELAHRIHMNHSSSFWSVVKKELPDYQLKRRTLKEYEDEIFQKY